MAADEKPDAAAAAEVPQQPLLRVVNPDATPEEVAAIVAVFAAIGSASGPAPRKDARFDYLDRLPANVPPVEHPLWAAHPSDAGGPAEATYYFPIEVMPPGEPNATGVFFPSGYGFPGKINVIVYFHGHKKNEFTTINEYWVGKRHGLYLREFINATGKPVVLIAPTLGAAPGSSINKGMGIFANPGAVDGFLAEVVRWIAGYVPQYAAAKKRPEIGNIVLGACLSSFGNVMGVTLAFDVPRIQVESLQGMLRSFIDEEWTDAQYALLAATRFSLSTRDVSGYLVVVLGVNSIERASAALQDRA